MIEDQESSPQLKDDKLNSHLGWHRQEDANTRKNARKQIKLKQMKNILAFQRYHTFLVTFPVLFVCRCVSTKTVTSASPEQFQTPLPRNPWGVPTSQTGIARRVETLEGTYVLST